MLQLYELRESSLRVKLITGGEKIHTTWTETSSLASEVFENVGNSEAVS